jgi:nucleoside-diphosphate-sugar epimerase
LRGELLNKKEIVIWGDGHQTEALCISTTALREYLKLLYSNIQEPINLGSAEKVSINQLVDYVEEIANHKLERKYDYDAPKGVRGRNSDNTLIKQYLGWEPSIPLKEGLKKTYDGIKEQLIENKGKDKNEVVFNKF